MSIVGASAGLVAHWPLDANALDATGNGHNGTVVGTVTFGQSGANGKTGSSADFPGPGHIDIPYTPDLNPGTQAENGSGSFSLAFWAFPTAAGGGAYRSPFTNREDNGTTSNGPMIYNDAAGNWTFWAGNNGSSGQWNNRDAGPVAVNAWTHVAITYDADTTTRKMLLNGVVVLNDVIGISANVLRAMHFGSGSDLGGDFYWDGRMDDIGFWDNALTEAQVQEVMTNGIKPDTSTDPNLLVPSPWPLTLTGAVQTFDITLNNGGATKALNITAAAFSGGNAASFSVVSLPGPIAAGGTGVVRISFNPAGVSGAVETILELTSNSAVNPVKPVTVTGFIHDPSVVSLTERLEFGTLPAGTSTLTKSFTLRNDGAALPLNVSAVTPAGPDMAAFTVTKFPETLAPGATGTVEVVFDPLLEDGSFVSRMLVSTDDPLTPNITVVLHAEVPVAKPLVAWWPLDANADDASGNGFNGVVTAPGAVSFTEAGANAATGAAADFTEGGHIEVPFDALLNPTSFTVTLWAKADGTSGYASPVTSRVHGGGGETNGYILYNADGGRWAFWTGQGVVNWDDVSGPAVVVGSWTHLAITYDAATDTKTLWVNGESAAVDTSRSAPTQYTPNYSLNLHLGAGDDNGLGFPFDGKLDDIAIYKKALSRSEIQSIMINGAGTPPVSAGFEISSLVRGPAAGQVTLAWPSTAGAVYTVQRTADFSRWDDLTPNVTAAGATAGFTDTTLPAGTSRVFYRVKRIP
ncbi:MAG: LamG-like jellyroll fold domain-containing protein [Verrucomicrobiota bacterium]